MTIEVGCRLSCEDERSAADRGAMRSLKDLMGVDARGSKTLRGSGLASVGIHVAVLLTVLGVFHKTPRLAPYRLPGTAQGVRFLAYYSPGSPAQPKSDVVVKQTPEKTAVSMIHSPSAPPKPAEKQAPPTETGSGTSAQRGRGEGDVTIALQTFFPYPKPNLSGLPRGTKGDVILDAVIDEQGRISDLTLVQGLGQPIDDVVIATVRQWSYTPAKKNGVPVASEQELHFHYERS
jgi:periplasmic protein TonB